jgi:integrase
MSNKRANHEGTIKQRTDGRWEARITLSDGRRKSVYAKTRQDVARRLTELLRNRDLGLGALDERQTTAQYFESWLAACRPTLKDRTWQRYAEYTRLHAIPVLGAVSLSKLTAQQVQALYAHKLDEGLSPSTVHHLHAVLHRALDRAVRLGLIYRNVADLVDPPRLRHREMATLTVAQARLLLAAAAGDRLEALYVLALTTGMRQGELLALRWRDVDLEGASLQVRATLQNRGGICQLVEPKTPHSRRRIALPRTAVEALRWHRARQLEERRRASGVWTDFGLVFANTVGRPLDGMNLLKYWFLPLLKRAGLPRVRFHDLRHTAATLLLAQGVNVKVVSEMLGHADVSITLRVYAHVLPHMQQQAAEAMDATFGIPSGGQPQPGDVSALGSKLILVANSRE